MGEVEAILLEDGPCLSSDLARKLTARGLSAELARQRIARAGSNVLRLTGLKFPRNARFLYHAQHDGGERYWDVRWCRFSGQGDKLSLT
jgi:hypothetical protein